ncbi:MAG TPA: hypothetical protein PK271_14675, partial [Hyphomicrobium sp.]|uniref:hypothetical protein n=1 Tax=Hyphomicrobium sp. TaxID=82 RepID=UPI002C83490E
REELKCDRRFKSPPGACWKRHRQRLSSASIAAHHARNDDSRYAERAVFTEELRMTLNSLNCTLALLPIKSKRFRRHG